MFQTLFFEFTADQYQSKFMSYCPAVTFSDLMINCRGVMRANVYNFCTVPKTSQNTAVDVRQAARDGQDCWHPVWVWWGCLPLDSWTVWQGEKKICLKQKLLMQYGILFKKWLRCVLSNCVSILTSRVTSFLQTMSTPSSICCGFAQQRQRMWRLLWESATLWRMQDPLNLSSV